MNKIISYLLISMLTIVMVGGIAVAGALITSIGVDKGTEDKAVAIIGEKKITEEQFVKNAITTEVQEYERQKIADVRMSLSREFNKCMQSNDLARMTACRNVLASENSKYEAPKEVGVGEEVALG